MAGFSSDLLGLDAPAAPTAEEDMRAKIKALKLANAQLKAEAKAKAKTKRKVAAAAEKKRTGGDQGGSSSSSSSSSDSSSSSSGSDSSDNSDGDSDGDESDAAAGTSAPRAAESASKTKIKKSKRQKDNESVDDDAASFFDSLADKPAEDVEVSGHEYVASLRCATSGSGIIWETDFEGKIATVKSFKRNEHGQHGPAANSGLIEVGHVLIAIDGKRVVGSAFEDQLRLLEGLAKAEGGGEYVVKMCDPERGDSAGASGTGSSGSGGKSMQRDAGMTNALRTVHRNKLKYYQALPPSQELTQCFLERYRGDHLTSFHVHRQADSAFILGASCPVAMKGDFVFHTLQDMTWEAKMTDIPHGKDIILFWLSNIYLCMRSSGFSRCTPHF